MDPWGTNICNGVNTSDDQLEKTFDSNFCLGNNGTVQGKKKSVLNDNYSNKLGKKSFKHFLFFFIKKLVLYCSIL